MYRAKYKPASPLAEPITKKIKAALSRSEIAAKAELFGRMTEEDFVEHRVNVYFAKLEDFSMEGLNLAEAERRAEAESLHGLNLG